MAGALIGLLFVAISVAGERLAKAQARSQVYRIRAHAALLAFLNALAVSLFSLIPGEQIGTAATVVSSLGLAFIMASVLSVVRLRQVRGVTARDGLFIVGLAVTFAIQLNAAVDVLRRPSDPGPVMELALLVTVCFFIGIARAWELIGGPSIELSDEVIALVRGKKPDEDDDGQPGTDGTHAPSGPESPGARQA